MVNALTKVGESITFSALTVIAALLSLLAATFQIYSQLGIPLAIGIAVMLLAGPHPAARPARDLRPGRVLAVQAQARRGDRPACGAGSRPGS